MKYLHYFFEILRSSPIIIDFILFTLYSVTNNREFIRLIIIKYLGFVINKILKNLFRFIFKNFGTKKNNGNYLPLLGRGQRPLGAKNCGLFNNCSKKLSTSYGFPSGHAQYAGTMLVIMNSIIHNPYHKIINLIYSLFIASARVYENCHTLKQVIAGYIIGIFITKYLVANLKI
jgi:membrane-associated phospholipid phosphatase